MEHIISLRPLIKESEINWKVTVPAIWKNKSKEIIIKASKLAGLFQDNVQSLFFCLEPEGAACDYISDKTQNGKVIEFCKIYIICDIGGGTIDISTHKRINYNGGIYIEEVYPPLGGNHGSTYINKRFTEKVLKILFGSNAMNKLVKIINNPKEDEDIYQDYCILLQEIEAFKDINNEVKDDAKRIGWSRFEYIIDEDFYTLIEKYNMNCPKGWGIKKNKGFKIFFHYQIMFDLTKEIIVDNVVSILYNIIDDINEKK